MSWVDDAEGAGRWTGIGGVTNVAGTAGQIA